MSDEGTDWGRLYGEHVAAITALAGTLTPELGAMTVPASPQWTVADVYRHLAGVASDTVTGRTDGAPRPTWTQRAVDERADASIEEALAELAGHVDPVAEQIAGGARPGIVWDLSVHHADLHEALGKGALPERLYVPVLEAVSGRAGEDVVAAVPAYELFRGLFSRRSQAQMAAWGVADQDRLDAMCVFGPREDDQPIPV